MAARIHRRDVRRFLIGASALGAVVVLMVVGIRTQTGSGLPGKPYTYVTVEFEDVGWLSTKAEVVSGGVRIGQVQDIQQRDGKLAVVRLRLDGHPELYADATAQVSNASLLGKRRVSLHPGTQAAGALGDNVIPVERTVGSTSLDDLYSNLDDRTRQALAGTLHELAPGIAGHQTDLRAFLRNGKDVLGDVGTISSTLADDSTDLDQLLVRTRDLASHLRRQDAELASLMRETGSTLAAVNVDKGAPLDRTLAQLPATLNVTREGLDSTHQPLADLEVAMSTLRPGAKSLGISADDLRAVLRGAVTPLRRVPGVSEDAVPAVEVLTALMVDARPLVEPLGRALSAADVLIGDLSPYSADIGRWASEHDVLSGRVRENEHFLSLALVPPGPGVVNLPDPTFERRPYPGPGGIAWTDSPGGH